MAQDVRDRSRALIEIGIALTSELSLDGVLQRVLEAAATLTDAQYAALGVIDASGRSLERFLTTGVDEATRTAIGDLPHGRGILGVLIRDAQPLRLHDLHEDPRSIGFPPGHPPMKTFLGVPILLRGVAYGNLYLTEKADGADFTDGDEELVQLLAAQAAVAIENARLYEASTRWSDQLESLNEVASALVSEIDLQPLLSLIADRLRDLIDARLVTISLPQADGALRIEAASGDAAEQFVGRELGTRSKNARVLARKRVERVDSVLEDPETDQETARLMQARSGLYVPLLVRDQAIGIIAVHDKQGRDTRFRDDDRRLGEMFAQRAAVAVDLSRRVAQDALRRIVAAQELERRRLARELHDETGQALTSILLGLRTIESAETPDDVKGAADELRELVLSTLHDVRRLAVELRPKALDDFGLEPALERLTTTFAEQTGLIVDYHARIPERLPTDVETALYRIVQEALTNIVKHAQATRVSVVVTRQRNSVKAVIEDDGVGFEQEETREDGLGLLGMRERLQLVGGRFTIESAAGSGTTLVAEVPT
ncbi:MAG TPA: GAF domain-containing protein [Gaiellaceae bacterium]